jgi:thiamine biosynthesis lipoprotein
MDHTTTMTTPTAHIFSHEAMKTTFTLRLVHTQAATAHAAANQAFSLIDEIENTLSRYVAGSDVSQINQMQSGQSLYISETGYACLRTALEVCAESGGLFDITLGRQIEHRKNAVPGDAPLLVGQLMLDPDRPAIHCIEAGREIDLGGIGKGYALDQLVPLLRGLGIESGLVAAGASTQRAFGEKAWTIERTGAAGAPLELRNQALSVSGIGIQGSHIVSPRELKADTYTHSRIWVLHQEAARADAWSTACLLMSEEELESLRDHLTIVCNSPPAP